MRELGHAGQVILIRNDPQLLCSVRYRTFWGHSLDGHATLQDCYFQRCACTACLCRVYAGAITASAILPAGDRYPHFAWRKPATTGMSCPKPNTAPAPFICADPGVKTVLQNCLSQNFMTCCSILNNPRVNHIRSATPYDNFLVMDRARPTIRRDNCTKPLKVARAKATATPDPWRCRADCRAGRHSTTSCER
jgi:hypothetical protein